MAFFSRIRSDHPDGDISLLADAPEPRPDLRKSAPATATATTRPDAGKPDADASGSRLGRAVRDSLPVTLLQAAHPRQAIATAAAMALAASLADRPLREVGVVAGTVLVGQAILGWHNDLVDRDRDAAHHTLAKPVAEGRLDPGSVWYAVVIGVLVVLPLSLTTGVTAGAYYLVSLVVGLVGNVALREGRFSFVPWAASFGLLPFYLSYGGWGGDYVGRPPQVAIVVLAALLGVGVHVVRAVWGLVDDDADEWTYLPLTLAERIGATRLMVLASVWCVACVGGLVAVGAAVGLRQ